MSKKDYKKIAQITRGKLSYWEKRKLEKLSILEAISDENIKRIDKAIDKAIANIEYEIKDLYIKYAEDNKLSYAATLKYLRNDERKEFQMGLKEYIDKAIDPEYESKYYKDLYSVSTRVRVKRLEALKANIRKEVAKVESELLSQNVYSDLYKESLQYEQYSLEQFTGMQLNFEKPNPNIIKELLLNPWSGKNYSQKVWGNTDKLIESIEEVLTKGLIQGKSVNAMTKELKHRVYGNGTTKNTEFVVRRLVQTEGAHIIEEATSQMYSDLGVEEYEISATLDLKTSKICQGMDLKRFKLKDKVIGVNYPPFHPFCRTTTIPVSKFDDIPSTRIAKDADGNTITVPKMSYEDWKKNTFKGGYKYTKNGTIIPTHIITTGGSNNLREEAFKVKEFRKTLKSGEVVYDRTFFDYKGRLSSQVHSSDHQNRKQHPYGKNGEHGHTYKWDDNDNYLGRETRELTDQERKENKDILDS